MSATSESAALPDVDTMITKLVVRLEKQPNDVKGWKMLGWSYLNTARPEEAARAYETALKLEPGDNEIRKGTGGSKSSADYDSRNSGVRSRNFANRGQRKSRRGSIGYPA